MTTHRWLRLATGAAAVGATLGLAAPAAHAAFAPGTTWTGTSATNGHNFSDPANWQGSTAPSGSVASLTFPDPAGLATPVDDEGPKGTAGTTPLTAGQLAFTATTATYLVSGDAGPASDALTLSPVGSPALGLVDSGTPQQQLSLPITLGTTQEWDINGGEVDLATAGTDATGAATTTTTQGTVSGATSGLTVKLSSPTYGANFGVDNGSIETSSFAAVGGNATLSGPSASSNGTVTLSDAGHSLATPDINATSGNPVTFTHTELYGSGKVGALTVNGGDVEVDAAAGNTGTSVLAAASATFDSTSQLGFTFNGPATGKTTVAGTDNSELTSTGAVALGGAALSMYGLTNFTTSACNAALTPGTTYTLVSAASVSGHLSDGSGTAIASGGTYQTSCGTTPVDLRIDYTPKTVTATVVTPTTTALTASAAQPFYGDTETLTATVSPAGSTGAVNFTETAPNGTPVTIGTCGAVAPNSNGVATCTTTYGAGQHNYLTPYSVVASFTGTGASGSSASPAQTVTPQGYKTTTTVAVAPHTASVGQPVTLTATVTGTQGTPTGAVVFGYGTGQSGDSIATCQNQPLTPSTTAGTATATCSWTPDQSQISSVGALYLGDATTEGAPSSGTTDFAPAPIAGAISSDAAQATNGTAAAFDPDSNVTATATGGDGTVISSAYSADPVAPPTGFTPAGSYFDVKLQPGATFTSVRIDDASLPAGDSLAWYDPAHGWLPVRSAPGQPYATILASGTSPTLSQLTGTVFAVAGPVAALPAVDGYRMVGADGGIFAFQRSFLGSTGSTKLVSPVVGGADGAGGGYYTVAADGGVFAFGAPYAGSVPSSHARLTAPIVGMAVDKATGGYWLAGADGNVYAFNAPGLGNLAGRALRAPIVGIAATPGGDGFYLVGRDGGVFTFGAAKYVGSTGALTLAKPIVGMAVSPTGGYWLVGADGGVFAFGAAFHGSAGALKLNSPVIGIAADPAGAGYWITGADGGVFSYGVPFEGSTGGIKLNSPIVAIAG